MPEETKSTPAYCSYSAFKGGIRGLVHDGNIPNVIDNSCLTKMSGSGRAQFLAALKFFGLAGPLGNPSPLLRSLALSTEPEWKVEIGKLLRAKYDTQLAALKDGTPNSFKASFALDSGIVTPAARFLLSAAEDAGLPISGVIKSQGIPSSVKKPRRERAGVADDSGDDDGERQQLPVGNPIHRALIDKFPEFDPAWGPEERKAWMQTFQSILAATGATAPGADQGAQ